MSKLSVFVVLVIAAVGGWSGYAYADGTTAAPAISITKTADGQPVFDANDDPGNDSGPDNGIVRTNDLVTYSVAMSINDPTAPSQTTFRHATATFDPLPLGFVWDSVPLQCNGGNSSLTGDGLTRPSVLVCDFGAKASGTTWLFSPAVKVLRTASSATVLAPVATLSADVMVQTATSVVDDDVKVSASTAPKAGVTIGPPRFFDTTVVGGQIGYTVHYGVGIHIDSGSNVIDGDSLSFTADLSDMPAGAQLVGCQVNGHGLDFPQGNGGTPPKGIPAGSGTWTCTPDPSNPMKINITVTGVDTNPAECSDETTSGNALPTGMCFVATQYLNIWFPWSSLSPTGTPITMWLDNLEAQDANGNPNYGGQDDPGTGYDNNEVAAEPELASKQHGWTSTAYQPTPAPGFMGLSKADYKYKDNANGSAVTFDGDSSSTYHMFSTTENTWTIGTTGTSGDGYVSQTGRYFAGVSLGWTLGVVDIPAGLTECTTIDNAHSSVIDLNAAMPTRGAFVQQAAFLDDRLEWAVQYGVGGDGGANAGDGAGWTDHDEQRAGGCDDGDSPTWYTDITAVPGGRGAITKVRMVSTRTYTLAEQVADVAAGNPAAGAMLQVALQVLPTTLSATIVPNYGWATNVPGNATSSNPNGTVVSQYNYQDATNGGFADRITVTGVRVRIDKAASVQQALAGDTVTFTLSPTTDALGASSPYDALNVTVTDTLPVGETYVLGSSACATDPCEPAITFNSDGTTTLVWSLGSPTAGTAITPITYGATIGTTVAGGTNLVNTAEVAADNDPSVASLRRDTATVNVVNSAVFAIAKSAVNPLTEPGELKTFRLTFQNLSSDPYPSSDFVDWLPYNGDPRTPSSNFHGTAAMAGPPTVVEGTVKLTPTFSKYDPSLLTTADFDPATMTSAIVWCTAAQFGIAGCPSSFAEVTGMRFSGGPIAPQAFVTFEASLVVTGDQDGDIFSNQVNGEVNGVGLLIRSNTATVQTVLGSISGMVWDDSSTTDGVLEHTTESDLSGVTVQLLDQNGAVTAATTTDANGAYMFAGLVHGTYSVHVVQPDGMSTTLPLQGSDAKLDSDIAYKTNTTDPIILAIGQDVTDVDAGFFTATPDIGIVKELNGAHVPDGSRPLLVATGSMMSVTFKVTNNGTVTLDPVTVTDDTVTGISCPKDSLAPKESMTCTATTRAPDTDGGVHVDHATATGTGVGLDGSPLVERDGTPVAGVTATDEAHAVTPDPKIRIEKKIDGKGADTAPGVKVPSGNPMDVTFVVTNTGNVPLTDVGVVDDVIAPGSISCPQSTLTVDETMTCTASWSPPVPGVQHKDTATATATPPVLPDGTVLDGVSDSDSAFAHTVADPSIHVAKTINGSTDSHTQPGVGVVADSTMQVSFRVTNTGDVRLEPVTVTDDKIATADIACPQTGLNAGESMTCTATDTAPAAGGAHRDVATATGAAAYPNGDALVDIGSGAPVGDVTDTADAYAQALKPGIGIVKTINGQIAESKAFGVLVPPGSTMHVEFLVTNTGETDLDQVVLSDDVIAAADISCPATTLPAGGSMTCTGTATAPNPGGVHHNTATVTGQPLGPDGSDQGEPITATADAWAITPDPSISVVKTINDADANTAGVAAIVPAGDPMKIEFDVTNTGNVALAPAVITDDVVPAAAITCPKAALSVGESMTCTAQLAPPAAGGLHTDTATATGTPATYPDGSNEPDVIDTDPANAYVVSHPSVEIVKYINGEDANQKPGVLVAPGSDMKIRFVVTNDGDVQLAPVTVTDDVVETAAISCPADALDAGASMICTATVKAPKAGGKHKDVATAIGDPVDPEGDPLVDPTTGVAADPVTDTDHAYAWAGAPSLALTKQVCARAGTSECTAWVAETTVDKGSNVQWRITVTNTGDVPIGSIAITDHVAPGCQVPAGTTLGAGQSVTVVCATKNVTKASLTNTAQATGTPLYPNGVTGEPIVTLDDQATVRTSEVSVKTGNGNGGGDASPGVLPSTGAPAGLFLYAALGLLAIGLGTVLVRLGRRR